MVVYKNNDYKEVSLVEATQEYKRIDVDNTYLFNTAKGVGISFGE